MVNDVRWNADDYARNSGVQAGWAEELVGKLPLRERSAKPISEEGAAMEHKDRPAQSQ